MAKGAKRGKVPAARPAAIPAQGMATEPRLVTRWRRMTLWMSVFLAAAAPPLVTFDYGEIGTGDAITGKEFLIPFVACVWAAATAGFAAAGLRLRIDWAGWSLLGVGGLALAWIPFSPYPQYTVPVVYVFVTPLAIYFMTASLTEKGKETLVKAVLIGAALAAVVTVIMTLMLIGIPKYPYFFYDTYGNKNLYAAFLVTALALAAYGTMNLNSPFWRWFCALIAVLAVAQVLATFSRGAYLALAVLAAGALFAFRARGLVLAVAGAAAAGALLLFSELGQLRFLSRSNLNVTLGIRAEIWSEAFHAFWSEPLFGVGPGLFQLYAKDHTIEALRGLRLADAHNDVIQLTVELGVTGCMLFMAPILWILWRSWRDRRTDLRAWAATGLMGLLAIGLVTSLTIRANTLHLIMLLVGLSARSERNSVSTVTPVNRRVTCAYGALLLTAVMAVFWGILFMAEKIQYASLKRVMSSGGINTVILELKAARIVDVYPEDPNGALIKAMLAMQAGDKTGYLAWAQKYAKNDPASPLRWLHLGYANLLNENFDEAERQLLDAFYWGAPNEATAGLLYAIYTFKGDRSKQEYYYQRASNQQMNGPETLEYLAKLGLRAQSRQPNLP